MKSTSSPKELESVTEVARAAVLLHPLRLRVLELAREPSSASEIAARLRLPRQRVNYHVRELERARFLKRTSRVRRRNLYEQRYVATARAYQLSPELLGSLGADPSEIEDRFSAAYLLALGERMQRDLGRASREAAEREKRLSTLSIEGEFRFGTPRQREAFALALREAITRVVAEHARPASDAEGRPAAGRPYRLLVGCYPIPPTENPEEESR